MSRPPHKPLVTISVFLFGKPAWEIDQLEGAPVDLELLDATASCGQELGRRLTRVAELGKRLVASGWEGYGLLYDVEFYKGVSLRDAEEGAEGPGHRARRGLHQGRGGRPRRVRMRGPLP